MADSEPKLNLNGNGYTITTLNSILPAGTVSSILSGIVFLHADCILTDHTLATFLPPLNHPLMLKWWQSRFEEEQQGSRVTWVILATTSSRTTGSATSQSKAAQAFSNIPIPTISISSQQVEVAGVISLSHSSSSQTASTRGVVEKLFVSPFHRRRGFARVLMAALDDRAWELGRWNLLLDTEVGSDAESVYPRLGYRRGMVVERYGYSPQDGREVDEVWFWKDLRWERGWDAVKRNGFEAPTVDVGAGEGMVR